jgi:hypothetical protein
MFPRGIPSAALPVAVTSALRTCSSRASRKLGSLSLASSAHLTPHGQPGGGARPPGSAPLHRLPARRPPPAAKMLRAPACGIVLAVRCHSLTHHASGPQKSRHNALGIALRERRSCRPHRTLARPPPGATASSDVLVIPGASAFVPHLCSLVIPAGTLDPAPCGGKEHLSVLRSQNPACTGFAKHRQPAGQGSSTSILGPARRSLGEGGCRAKSAGQAWFKP